MRVTRPGLVALVAWSGLAGCSKEAEPSPNPPPPAPAGPSIVGEWTTSNDPALASSATTMTLRESGELSTRGPLRLLGKVATYKDEAGKERVAPFIGSGTWEREGDRLTTRVTTANLAEWKGEPATSRIAKLTDTQLVLDHDGEVSTYFRVERPGENPGVAKSP